MSHTVLLKRLQEKVTTDDSIRFSIDGDMVRAHYPFGTYDAGPTETVENVLNAQLPEGWRLHYGADWIITESESEPHVWWDACEIEVDEFMTANEIQITVDDAIDEYDRDKAPFWVAYPDGWEFDGIGEGPSLAVVHTQTHETVMVPITDEMDIDQMQAAVDSAFAARA